MSLSLFLCFTAEEETASCDNLFFLKIYSLISLFELSKNILSGLTIRSKGNQCCSQAYEASGLSMDLSLLVTEGSAGCQFDIEFRKPLKILYGQDIIKTQPWERIDAVLWHEKPIKTLFLKSILCLKQVICWHYKNISLWPRIDWSGETWSVEQRQEQEYIPNSLI